MHIKFQFKKFDLDENIEETNRRHVLLKPVEIPIQADILYNLSQFCFPSLPHK